MKVCVEFGKPQSALAPDAPCGVSGQHVCESAKSAASLASEMVHVLSERRESMPRSSFTVRRNQPRITWWSNCRDAWVTVSVIQNQMGAYAALADKEAKNEQSNEPS